MLQNYKQILRTYFLGTDNKSVDYEQMIVSSKPSSLNHPLQWAWSKQHRSMGAWKLSRWYSVAIGFNRLCVICVTLHTVMYSSNCYRMNVEVPLLKYFLVNSQYIVKINNSFMKKLLTYEPLSIIDNLLYTWKFCKKKMSVYLLINNIYEMLFICTDSSI